MIVKYTPTSEDQMQALASGSFAPCPTSLHDCVAEELLLRSSRCIEEFAVPFCHVAFRFKLFRAFFRAVSQLGIIRNSDPFRWIKLR